MSKATEQFEIQTRLAVGDAGLVYRAVDKAGRTVALKLLLTEAQVAHPLDVEALLRDAPQIQTVAGVNIVQLLEAFADEDGTVLVYECAEGLRGLDVPGKRPISAAHAVDVAAQLLSALRSGERQRYPHGDLKPSDTVIIDLPDGRPLVMVLDWGLANYRVEISPESYAYVAPERLAGGAPSHTADLFSAGATLHYLFSGKRLLPCSTREEFKEAWPSLDVRALGAMRPDLPKELVGLIARLISPDPAQRPETAVKALEELSALKPPLPPAVPETIRPRAVRAAPSPQSGIVAPTSGIRKAPVAVAQPVAVPQPVPVPRASAVQPVPVARATAVPQPQAVAAQPAPMIETDVAEGTSDIVAAANAELALLKKKRQKLTMICSIIGLVACLGFAGAVVWKNKQDAAVRAAFASKEEDDGSELNPRSNSADAPPVSAPKKPTQTAKAPPKTTATKPKETAKAPVPAQPPAAAVKPPPGPTVLVRDSFEYAAGGKLAGLNGGTGWTGPWEGDGATVEAESLAISGPAAKGAKLHFPSAQGEAVFKRGVSPNANLITSKGGTFYFALSLIHSGKPDLESEFQFNPLDGTAISGKAMRVIVRDQGKGFEVALFTVNQRPDKEFAKVPNGGKVLNLVQRIVVKPLPNGQSNIASDIWLNPDPKSASPPPPQLSYAMDAPLPPQITLMLRKKPIPTTRVDEVRYSQTWEGLWQSE